MAEQPRPAAVEVASIHNEGNLSSDSMFTEFEPSDIFHLDLLLLNEQFDPMCFAADLPCSDHLPFFLYDK